MPNRPVLIDSFTGVPGTAEIVGIGGVRQPRGEAQEVEVEVVVASDLEGATFDSNRDVSSHWLGCGQLDLLAPGSRWLEGRRAGWADAQTVEASFECAWAEHIGTGLDPQPRGHPFPSRRFAAVSGFVLRRVGVEHDRNSQPPRGEPDFVLLPPMELLRTLFGVSNGFLLELFDGIRNPAVAGERGLVSRRLSRVREDGTVVLVAGRGLSRDEAIIAAAIITDKVIRRLHDASFQQLSVDPEARDGRSALLELTWPWRTPVPIRLAGRWVDRINAPRRFIAFRIEAIGLPLLFERVEVQHPGSETGASDDMPPPEGRTRSANARLVVLTTGRAASTMRRPVEVSTGKLDLTTAKDIEVVLVAQGGAVRRDRGGIGEDPRDAAPFGSGGRQPGADQEMGSAALRRRAGQGEVPDRSGSVALRLTWEALESASRSQGWTLDLLPIAGPPLRRAPHGGFKFTREPLVAVIKAGSRRVLIVDRGSPLGDERSLGLLVPKDERMSDRALANAARTACRAVDGRWRSPRVHIDGVAPDFRVKAVARDLNVWICPGAHADLIRRRIASALGR